ncbi:MAG: asparagine synthase (glutamine-hydrolyzing) [Carbonactinosporaceae bacterium]
MCGICGVVRASGVAPEDASVVGTLNNGQRHRGPDDTGLSCCGGATLGQTRLAIVDLTDGGRQPFNSADGSISVVFNGEIYNHEELRRRHRVPTTDRCDGAILPDLWARLGPSLFQELRGMYAIAVHDARTRTTTLARDPFGIKPLYWTRTAEGVLAFASEPRPLLPLVPRPQLSGAALHHYLMFGAMARDESPFTQIESVAPNAWVQWDEAMVRRDGEISQGLFEELPATTRRQLREQFVHSVSMHLNSDVPVALLLSSGLDSASIAWACAQLGVRLTCLTVDMGAGTSEQAGAGRVARRFGHTHEVVTTSPDAALVERYFSAMQRPSIDGLNVFLVSQAIASLGIKVALSGLGGDETLAGYPAFRLLRYLPLLRAGDALLLTRSLARYCRGRNEKLAHLLGPAGPRDPEGLGLLLRRVFMDERISVLAPWTLSTEPVRRAGRGQSARRLSENELEGYLGGTLLPDADACSMAWSVEMRVPYVDVPFARAALAAAPRRGVGKHGFARTLGDEELVAIAKRPKCGFTLPMDSWMRHGPLAPRVRATTSSDAPVRQVLRPEAVDHLLAGWEQGRSSWSRAWSIVSLDAWLRTLPVDALEVDAVSRG